MDEQRAPAPHRVAHMPALDGLRAVALIFVLGYHGGLRWIEGGYLPLSTFFVLSGFLITTLLLVERRREGRIDLVAFWGRRVRRLAPAALAALILIAAYLAWGADGQQPGLRGDMLSALGWVANWRFILSGHPYADVFSDPSPLQHYWSLAVEEQFYLVLPILAIGLLALGRGRRWPFALVVGALTIASTVWMAVLHHPGDLPLRAYFGTDTRAAELLVGVLLACALVDRSGRVRRFTGTPGRLVGTAGLGAFVATMAIWVVVDEQNPHLYRGGLLASALLAAVVVTAATDPARLLARALSWRPLVWLGGISYAMYLFHWPLFLWLSPERTGLRAAPVLAVQVGLTTALAWASMRWLERPFRERRLPTTVSLVGWANATVAAAAIVLVAAATLPSTELDQIFERQVGVVPGPPPSVPITVAPEPAPATNPPTATPAHVAVPPRVMIIGDSVGMAMAYALQDWSDANGRLVMYDGTQLGCSISRGGAVHLSNGTVNQVPESCGWWATPLFQERLREFQPDVILVMAGTVEAYDRTAPQWDGLRAVGDPTVDDYLLSEWAAAVDAMSTTHATIVWATPPCVDFSRSTNVLDPALGNPRLDFIGKVLVPRLAAQRNIDVVDFGKELCPDGHFTDDVFGVPNGRPDGVHFTDDAALAVVDGWLGPLLEDTDVLDDAVDDAVDLVP